jgi:hypothetical protein
VATAFAIGYRWRWIASLQLLMAIVFARETSLGMSDVPLYVSVEIFVPSIALPYLTLHWLSACERSARHSGDQPEKQWEPILVGVLFVALLFFSTSICLYGVNRAMVFGNYYKLEPEGVSLIALILILATGYALAFGALSYYRIVTSDQRQLRLHLHQVLHKCCHKDERLLFRKRRVRNANTTKPLRSSNRVI